MSTIAQLGSRELFPLLETRPYLNHAAVSPPSRPVCDAVAEVVADYAAHGLGALGRWRPVLEEARALFGTLIGASPDDIALINNTTQGVIDIALCFPWRPGDRVVLFDGEFPTNVTPWQRAAELYQLELEFVNVDTFLESDEAGLAELDAVLSTGRTRLVAVSAVQFKTGLRMPLAQIGARAHAAGAELFVDGIQACGIVPLDVSKGHVDYLSCGSHKWLMGLEGAAFLYVSPTRVRALRPVVAGWLSHEDPFKFLMAGAGHLRYDRPVRRDVRFLECGAPNVVGFVALVQSMRLLVELGVDNIFEHVNGYIDRLEADLIALGYRSYRAAEVSRRSGSLSVLPPTCRAEQRLADQLEQIGIAAATPDGVLRLSPHWPNSVDEIDGLAGRIHAAASA